MFIFIFDYVFMTKNAEMNLQLTIGYPALYILLRDRGRQVLYDFLGTHAGIE